MIECLGPYLLGPNDTPENGIYTGDARELARAIPDESVDLILTDPPFFCPAAHYQSRVKWQRRWADMSILTTWWAVICDEAKRILKPSGYAITFCNADSFPAFYPAMYNRWDRLSLLVWDKLNPGLGRNWRHQHELILVACQTAAYLPDDGKMRTDVLRCKATPSADRQHPVQKPVALLRNLVEAASPHAGLVVDLFCGSGTTLEACILSGRGFLGFEKDCEYADLARERVCNTQPPLFVQ